MTDSNVSQEVPLFPLRTVLFPAGRLPLLIFEPRYLDMVSHCMKSDTPFVVVLIRNGSEVLSETNPVPPKVFDIGTLARIADWDSESGGRLRIVAEGVKRVKIGATRVGKNKLLMGDVELIEDAAISIGENNRELVEILDSLLLHPLMQQLGVNVDASDDNDRLGLLCQYLPIEENERYRLLALDDGSERLEQLQRLVEEMQ